MELGDRTAVGRTCGNLGNAYYLLGDFENATRYHQQVGLQTVLLADQFNPVVVTT